MLKVDLSDGGIACAATVAGGTLTMASNTTTTARFRASVAQFRESVRCVRALVRRRLVSDGFYNDTAVLPDWHIGLWDADDCQQGAVL